MREVVVIVAKVPLAGFSKTRLANDLGERKTYDLYQCFLRDFFARLAQNLGRRKIYLFITPWSPEGYQFFEQLLNEFDLKAEILAQFEISFFKRLQAIFKIIEKREGGAWVHLTGTDIPDFPFEIFTQPKSKMSVVVGADTDGGYYYLGSQSKHTVQFEIENEIEMGQSVFEATRLKIKEAGLNFETVKTWSDVDTKSDLEKLLKRTSFEICPNTLSYVKKNLPNLTSQ